MRAQREREKERKEVSETRETIRRRRNDARLYANRGCLRKIERIPSLAAN